MLSLLLKALYFFSFVYLTMVPYGIWTHIFTVDIISVKDRK